MNCVYTYNGRDYSYAEFAAALHEGLLEDLSANGDVVLDVEIPKIETNAIQEPSTTGMDVRQQARNGEAVGEGNAQKEEVAQAQEEKEVISIDEKIQKAYEIENEDERKNALDAIFNSDEYKKYVEDAESELKNNTTKVKEGKGSWRKSFNETNDALIKKDILRTVAEKSSSVSELNDISEAAKGLPEMLKNEVDNAVDYRMKSLSAQEEKEVVSPTEQVEQPAEFEEVKQAKEKFYKHTQDKGYVEVKRAKPVYIFGTEKAFYVKEGKEFVVSDAITGAEIGRGSTLNNAVASAEENAGSVQNLESARERFTDAYGKSPYAKLQEEFSFTQSIINNAMDMADVVENEADAFVAKTENEQIADRIRSKKINGALSAIDFGLTTTIYNGALTFMANQVEKGTKLGNAIANTIKWIDEKMQGKKWDKGKFGKYMNDQYKVKMSNGDVVEVVRDDSKETAAVINGFYSDIEQRILDQKGDKKASEWLTIIGKGDEAKYTGVADWLASKGNEVVSKKELQDWMRDNRIEVVEVVKGNGIDLEERIKIDKDIHNKVYQKYAKDRSYIVKNNGKYEYWNIEVDNKRPDGVFSSYEDAYAVKEIDDKLRIAKNKPLKYIPEISIADYEQEVQQEKNKINNYTATKFSQYQLEGEKEGYREVLVALPSKGNLKERWGVLDNKGRLVSSYNSEAKAKAKSESIGGTYRMASNVGEADPRVNFKSSHFDEPNILVHLRMNVRTDADGNKVLFLEEIQSDWGQQGKKQGFDLQKKYDAAKKFYNQIWKPFVRKEITKEEADKKHGELAKETGFTKTEIYDEASRWGDFTSSPGSSNVPLAPFVTDTNAWVKLGLKVAMQHAVREGATKIAWTTGEQQNERYDLSKQVDKIESIRKPDGTYQVTATKDKQDIFSENGIDEKRIENVFGKDIAQKITSSEKQYTTIEGDGLKAGGKGMKGFYGSPTEETKGIVGSVAESLTGQKVGQVEISTDKKGYGINNDRFENGIRKAELEGDVDAVKYLKEQYSSFKNGNGFSWDLVNNEGIAGKYMQDESSSTQNSIDITPELKAKITFGVPMFGGLGKINTNAYLDTMENKGIIKRDCE